MRCSLTPALYENSSWSPLDPSTVAGPSSSPSFQHRSSLLPSSLTCLPFQIQIVTCSRKDPCFFFVFVGLPGIVWYLCGVAWHWNYSNDPMWGAGRVPCRAYKPNQIYTFQMIWWHLVTREGLEDQMFPKWWHYHNWFDHHITLVSWRIWPKCVNHFWEWKC